MKKIVMLALVLGAMMFTGCAAHMYQAENKNLSQTIININVKHAIVGLPPFYVRNIYTATGTIVEFIE